MRRQVSIELEADDLLQIMAPDKFNKEISPQDVVQSLRTPLSVKYDYIDLGKTKYNFMQEFCAKDTQRYFSIMKRMSSRSVSSIHEDAAHDLHFHLAAIRGNLKRALLVAFPQAVEMPLYTTSPFILQRKKPTAVWVFAPLAFILWWARTASFTSSSLTRTTS